MCGEEGLIHKVVEDIIQSVWFMWFKTLPWSFCKYFDFLNMNYLSLVFEFGEFLWWKRLRMWEDATVPNGSDRGRRKSQSLVLPASGDSPVQSSLKPVYRKTSECSRSAAGNFQVITLEFDFVPSSFSCLWILVSSSKDPFLLFAEGISQGILF